MKYLRVFTNSLVLQSVIRRLPALFLVGGMLLALLPVEMALGSDRKAPLAYVTQRDAQPDDQTPCSLPGSVAVIDTMNNEVVATIAVGPGPHGMALTSDGKRAYVANYGVFPSPFAQATCLSDTVAVLKLFTPDPDDVEDSQAAQPPAVVALVKVGRGPLGVAVTPNNDKVFVTNFGQDATLVPGGIEGDTVSVINTRSNEVVATIPVGKLPAGVAIRPDGKRAYVTSRRNNEVWVLDTATDTVVDIVKVQIEPANVVFTPDGRRVYVANFGSNSVSVIDTATNTVMPVPDGEAITVGPGPRAVAITPEGAYAYVTDFLSDTVSVIATATNTVVDTIAVAGGPNWVTITGGHGKVHKKHD